MRDFPRPGKIPPEPAGLACQTDARTVRSSTPDHAGTGEQPPAPVYIIPDLSGDIPSYTARSDRISRFDPCEEVLFRLREAFSDLQRVFIPLCERAVIAPLEELRIVLRS